MMENTGPVAGKQYDSTITHYYKQDRLTQYHGNVVAWPVYLTIENLKAQVQQQQTWPSCLLIEFIPVVTSGEYKAKVWHNALRVMLERKSMIVIKPSLSDLC